MTRSGILLLLIVVGIEANARFGHDRTVAQLQKELAESERSGADLSLAMTPRIISGLALRADSRQGDKGLVTYRWPSLFKNYELNLNVGLGGTIVTFDTGAGAIAARDDPLPQKKVPHQIALRDFPSPSKGFAQPLKNTIGVLASEILSASEPIWSSGEDLKFARGVLVREVIRQGFILGAHEELQQFVRDESLGDDLGSDPSAQEFPYQLIVDLPPTGLMKIAVSRRIPGKPPYSRKLEPMQLDMNRFYESLLEQVEPLSRTIFVEALRESGVAGQSNVFHKVARLPAELNARLYQIDEMSQLTAVRELHALIRKEGESPDRLAALVRVYANLGSLTENHWQTHHKAFKARALLYAQRLIALDKNSNWAIAHRGYAWALTGRLKSAQDDFERAAVKWPQENEAGLFPRWILDAHSYCTHQPAKFHSAVGKNWALAAYLHLLSADPKDARSEFKNAAKAFMNVSPGCARGVLMQGGIGDLVSQRTLAEGGLQTSWPNFYRSLQAIPGLPFEAAALIKKHASSQTARSDEPRDRMQVIRLLSTHSTAGPGPSFSVYGLLMSEISFLHAEFRIDVMKRMLGLPTDALVKELAPTITGHPYARYLLSQVSDPHASRATFKEFYSLLKQTEIDLNMSSMLTDSYTQDPATYDRACRRAIGHSDLLPRDLLEELESVTYLRRKAVVIRTLNEVAPNNPQAIALRVSEIGPKDVDEAQQLEKRYDQNPRVLQGIADWFTGRGDYDDALRCIKRRIAIAPEHAAYRALAELYRSKNDLPKWKETLEEILTRPAEGLGHAYVESELAYYHMHRNELNLALPYAKSGAQSYSAWGLKCASLCNERLGKLSQSEDLMEACAERYDTASFDWLFWCVRTGHGDLAGARRYAQRMLEKRQNDAVSKQLELAIYYLIEKDPVQARLIFEKVATATADRYISMHIALLADISGDVKRRDSALAYIQHDWRSNWTYGEFANVLVPFLATPDLAHWNKQAFWRLLGKCSDGDVTNFYYFAGRFLELHGQPELGLEYLKLAASSPERHKYNCMLAAQELRSRGVAIPAIRPYEPGGDLADFGPVRDELQRCWTAGQLEKIVELTTQSVTVHPDWSFLLVDRGVAYENLGKYREAIADFEQAIERSPDESNTRRSLAMLRGACEDPAFRDPVESLKHAERGYELAGHKSYLYCTCLAVAFAANGDFEKAVEWQKKAVNDWPDESMQEAKVRLKLFEEKKPYVRLPRKS